MPLLTAHFQGGTSDPRQTRHVRHSTESARRRRQEAAAHRRCDIDDATRVVLVLVLILLQPVAKTGCFPESAEPILSCADLDASYLCGLVVNSSRAGPVEATVKDSR